MLRRVESCRRCSDAVSFSIFIFWVVFRKLFLATAKLLKTFCLKTENITEDFKRLFTSIFLMNSPFIMWT